MLLNGLREIPDINEEDLKLFTGHAELDLEPILKFIASTDEPSKLIRI